MLFFLPWLQYIYTKVTKDTDIANNQDHDQSFEEDQDKEQEQEKDHYQDKYQDQDKEDQDQNEFTILMSIRTVAMFSCTVIVQFSVLD